jgi:hypothetical protein
MGVTVVESPEQVREVGDHRDGAEMREAMQAILELPEFATQLSQSDLR